VTAILINGKSDSKISVLDRGLHYGDGVFETLKVAAGYPQLLEQHLQRLFDGCSRLRIPQPSVEALTSDIDGLLQGINKAVIKILVTRGEGGRGYRFPNSPSSNRIVIRYDFPEYPPDFYRQGVKIRLCEGRLSTNTALAGIKHLNRLEQVLARSEWQDESIAEGLMMDRKGNIIEGTMSNVFLVSKNRILTPDLTMCGVAGIMRQQVLDRAQELGIGFDIREAHKEDLFAADEVFLTNSVISLWPVRKLVNIYNHGSNLGSSQGFNLRNTQIEYKIGPITKLFMGVLFGD
jgi:4-amino-4-deoxychorismate lyase